MLLTSMKYWEYNLHIFIKYAIMSLVWCIMLVITLFEGRAKNLPIVQLTLCLSASSAQVGVDR